MKKITLIGGAGYLGSRIIEEFLRYRPEIKIEVIDRCINNKFNKVDYIESDVRTLKKENIRKILNNTTDVFLLNGLLANDSNGCSRNICYDNYFALVKIIRSTNNKSKIHFFSSQAVFDGEEKKYDITDNSIAKPVSTYAKCKVMVEDFLKDGDYNYNIYRLATCFGTSRNYNSDTFLNRLYKSSLDGGSKINIKSSVNTILSSLSITCLARFMITSIDIDYKKNIFHLSSDMKTIKEYLILFENFFKINYSLNDEKKSDRRIKFVNSECLDISFNIEKECMLLLGRENV
ncbi:NAD(P)-dependent oxidoreductase [Xenorhabdus khoisanae]|uniref:NAD(P)-dependent oxidoreductase n=1 Tax=Xenorhabdus khoisanae TaxID=880157 RepID=UPI0032B7A93C